MLPLSMVKMPLDASESSCVTSNYWDVPLPHLMTTLTTNLKMVMGPNFEAQFPHQSMLQC